MSTKNFIDQITIKIQSGNGGFGSIHFRREKFLPKGGPDGGDGGDGGNIIIQGDSNLNTLLHLRYNKHIKATNGTPGQRANKHGDNGKDKIIKVPVGTVVKNFEGSEILTEILYSNEQIILAKGGKGGYGNTYFKSSTNQTPRYAQPGLPGEEKTVIFELKILADIGLIGFPNAGKSSLLASLTAAKPKIGSYPFTTLNPGLGVVKYFDKSFVIADIPGIIEGASKGKGLGIRFLRHIERNIALVFVIDPSSGDISKAYKLLLQELKNYNIDLLLKNRLIVISKSDLLSKDEIEDIKEKHTFTNAELIFISNFTKQGLEVLKSKLWELIKDESICN